MSALDLFFPPRCAACGELLLIAEPLCESCQATLTASPEPACACCAGPVDSAGMRCGTCAAEPPAFSRVCVAFSFAGAIADAIVRFKYRDKPFLAAPLVEIAYPSLEKTLLGCNLIAPIPLHGSRLRERGYDQALLLARAISRRSGISHSAELLRRIRPTSHQVGQTRRARAENLAGAFACATSTAGLRVALVDDVVTTTATAREASRALVESGAAEVRVLALARAI